DAAAQPAGGLGLFRPDGRQHLHDVVDTDLVDRELANDRVHVHPDGAFPLGDVLLVLPAGECASMYRSAHSAKVGAFWPSSGLWPSAPDQRTDHRHGAPV